ncbi:MAG: CHASE3 domain-containing protein, partial [Desulfobacterales bacterium]|nr:CHASE3 domain-containing protein [Desulfobacterales bacterium]
KDLSLKKRILFGYSVPVILPFIAFLVIYFNADKLEHQQELVDKANEITIKTIEIGSYLSEIQKSSRGYIIVKNENSLRNFEKYIRDFKENYKSLEKMITDPKQQDRLQKIGDLQNKIEEYNRNIISLINDGEKDKAVEIFKTSGALTLSNEIRTLIDDFYAREEEIKNGRKGVAQDATSVLKTSIFIGVVSTVIVSILFGLWIASGISSSIAETIRTMSTASTEMATTVAQHERTASQQAVMINEMTTTMDELGASAWKTAEQSEFVVENAKNSTKIIGDGSNKVRQAITSMDGLKDRVGTIADQILKLSEQTSQVGTIAEIIKDLSSQINMLALNAAVEAARAGEHGKGFAVVSAEVRKLAAESKKSVEQAKTIISDVQRATNSTIMATEEGTKAVDEVTGLARKVGELFEDLSGAVENVYNNSQQSLLNAKQQSTAIKQVVDATNTINTGAKETAAGISQTKIGIEKLNEAAQKLKTLV